MKCTLIDNSTGEVITENFIVDTLEEIQRKKTAIEKEKLSKQFKEMQQNYLGNFIFFIFKNIDTLKQSLNDNDLVKFVFIGTYIKPDGYLKLDNNITYIDKKRLKQLLSTSDKAFNEFYNKLISNELLQEHENKLYINLFYFWRGKEKQYKKITDIEMIDFTRVYIKTTRELYYSIPSRSHKRLAIIYKLLPFVSWKYNILCNNINETNRDIIEPLTIGNVMESLGYDKTNITRFKKDFYSLKYDEYSIFASVQKEPDYLQSFILVNPLVFYRGNDIKELEYLITLFKLKVIIKNN